MPPSWIPLCRSMQLYCEPYFTSINNWRKYKEESILFNRMKVAHTLGAIFHLFSNNPTTYKFDIICQNEDAPLLPEVIPSAGREYRVNGDQIAFEAAMKTQPKELFQRAGVFFQDNLLKGIAGWSKEILDGANLETRASIIECVNKLLRLSEEAGDVRIIYTVNNGTKQYSEYPLSELDVKALAFFQYIVETRQEGFSFDKINENQTATTTVAVVSKSKRENTTKKKRMAEEMDEEWDMESTGIIWLRKHPSVGTQVAAHFPPLTEKSSVVQSIADLNAAAGKLFRGKVVKYAAPSAPGLTDQLYHILWEDGDEQDFDEGDMERGMDLFDQLEGWSKRHRSVGTRVAAYFDVPVKAPGGRTVSEQRLYFGTVTKYGTPLNPEDIPLYHVVYDDGDEQDINEHELTLGAELYKARSTESNSQKTKKAKTSAASPTPSVVGTTTSASTKSPKSTSNNKAKKEPPAKTKSVTKGSSKTPTKKLKKEIKELEEVGEEEGEDDPVWTMHHHSVGKRVAQHFVAPGSGRGGKQSFEVYGGTVAAYAPPSAPRAKDQLYHIVWDDADEQDFDEGEFQHGLALLDSLMPTPLHIASDKAKALVLAKQKEMAVDYEESKKPSSKVSESAKKSKPETAVEPVQTSSSSSSSSAEVTSFVDRDDGVDIVNTAAAAAEDKVESMAEEAVEQVEAVVADTVLASSSVLQSATDSLAAVASATMSAIAEAMHVASDAAMSVTHQEQNNADPSATEVDTLPATVTECKEQTQVNTAEMDVETVSLHDSDN